jgi:RND family efflux transporter MFP subunit
MVSKWATRAAKVGLLLGGCALAFVYLDPASGPVDANERVKDIVAAATTTPTTRPLELTQTEVTSVEAVSMVERLRVSGELQPVNRAVIRAKAGGKVIDVRAREGERVQGGEVIVRFETDDLQSTLKQRESDRDAAEAELVLATQALNRVDQLAAKKVASREQLEKAKSDVAANTARVGSLSAQVNIARAALCEAEVRAPFDGVVASRAVEAGSHIATDAELLTIVDTTALEARVLVSTRDIPRVAVNQAIELQIDGMDGRTIRGAVSRINPVAESGTRFVPVYLRLPNHDGKLWGGMFSTGSILVREKDDALVVPALSLRKDEAGDYVLKLQNGHLQRQPVILGPAWNGSTLIEISDGLSVGDTIVTAPLPALQPNIAVTVNKAG